MMVSNRPPNESARFWPGARAFSAFIAVIAWFALLLQLVLILRSSGNGIGAALAIVRFLSFFTILSNVFVAVVCTALAVDPRGNWLATARLRGAAALYIAVTGGIYLGVLRGLWQPQGAQLVADVLLHYAVPALYVVHWLVWAPRRTLAWSDVLRWLAFPLLYWLWAVWRGSWAHEYPYPFLDVSNLGLVLVARNSLAVAALFAVLGAALVAINRMLLPRNA